MGLKHQNDPDLIRQLLMDPGIWVVVGMSNNRARTAPELRKAFEIHGGNLATTGAVGFQFAKQGIITIKADATLNAESTGTATFKGSLTNVQGQLVNVG